MKPITVKSALLALAVTPLLISAGHAAGSDKQAEKNASQTPSVDRVKEAGKLVLCADPNNMPYAKSTPEPTGLDVEIAAEIAKDLGVKLGHYWYAQNWGRRAMRQLREAKCDIFLGLPAPEEVVKNSRSMIFTEPYYKGGFAILKRKDSKISSFDDIKGKKVSVVMVTVPDVVISNENSVANKNGKPVVKRDLHRFATQAYKSLLDGNVDAAILTAAEGGWLSKDNRDVIEVLPKTRPDFAYPLAVGIRKAETDLRDAVDASLKAMKSDGRLQKILDKYGIVEVTASANKT